MTALARNDVEAAALGRAAYDWYWQAPWTTEAHVDELLEIYAELAGPLTSAPTPVTEGILA